LDLVAFAFQVSIWFKTWYVMSSWPTFAICPYVIVEEMLSRQSSCRSTVACWPQSSGWHIGTWCRRSEFASLIPL